MRASRILILAVSGALGMTVGWLWAQGTTPPAADPKTPPAPTAQKTPAVSPPAATPPAVPAPPTPEEAEFTKMATEWKTILGEMNKLQAEYQIAKPADRIAIEQKFNALLQQAQPMQSVLKQAGEKAVLANPKNGEVVEFLLSVAAAEMREEQHAEAWRIAKVLQKANAADIRVKFMISELAWMNNDFPTALAMIQAVAAEKPGKEAEQELAKKEKYAKMWEAESKLREAEAKADDLPRIKLQTTKGDIVLELFENEAPNTVANFVSLVEKKAYDGTIFHRVLPMFMAQGGDPKGNGSGGPGYTIKCEVGAPNARNHFRGTLSMAHAGKDTGGSQFFMTFVPTEQLDGKHTVFGRVIEGLDVLDKIQRINPEDPQSSQIKPDSIVNATVIRKRAHEYAPVTAPDTRKR